MKIFTKAIIDTIGRGSICVLSAVAINKSTWYQAMGSVAPLTDPYSWIVALSVVGCLFWLFEPITRLSAFRNKTTTEVEE